MKEFPRQTNNLEIQGGLSDNINTHNFLELHRQSDGQPLQEDLIDSTQELTEAGIHLHFEDHEIESKLDIEPVTDAQQLLEKLRVTLEDKGYTFLEDEEITRDNYICYYLDSAGKKHKVVIRNNGSGGYQLKHKGKSLDTSSPSVRIKKETKGRVRQNLQEAEQDLPDDTEREPILIVKSTKHKLTLCARDNDALTRYFRLAVDETILPESTEEKMCKIELEYKGSDQEHEDELSLIEDQMEKIMNDIRSMDALKIDPDARSKFKWGMKRSKKQH